MFFTLASDNQKTDWLVAFAQQDNFYRSILDDLSTFGFEISYPFWGKSGGYRPYHSTGQSSGPAQFTLSPRYGRMVMAHAWLHELTHFYQDMHGLFFKPLIADKFPIILDAKTYIQVYTFCEAMAETEAILASHRLKEQGRPQAWHGALLSMEWTGLVLCPQSEIYERWYQTHQHHYERQALKMYEKELAYYKTIEDTKNIKPYLRTLNLNDLLSCLPQRPRYIRDQNFREVKDSYILKRLEKFYEADNANFQDIEIGSSPYIWKHKKDKAA